jgi:ribonuclease HI
MAELKKVSIYTDGACFKNPGPGGYGVLLLYGRHRKELSGGFRRTTNNRMEIMAAIVGLEALKYACRVTIYTDSQYLAKSMTKRWVHRWREHGWMRNREEKACNHDLWQRLLCACSPHKVKFKWLRGHAGHRENERCDELAVAASQRKGLPADEGYEAERLVFSRCSTLFDDRST